MKKGTLLTSLYDLEGVSHLVRKGLATIVRVRKPRRYHPRGKSKYANTPCALCSQMCELPTHILTVYIRYNIPDAESARERGVDARLTLCFCCLDHAKEGWFRLMQAMGVKKE